MKIRIVGCSGSYAGAHSPASCYLVSARDESGKEWHIVLDLGSGSFGQLQRYVDPFHVDAVAFSHLHADHVCDVTGLEVYLMYHPESGWFKTLLDKRRRLPVIGPPQTQQRIGDLCGTQADSDPPQVFCHTTWNDGCSVNVGPFTLTPYLVEHPVEAYAMRITGPSESTNNGTVTFTFSGDTDECPGVEAAATKADLFLCEAAFIEGRDDAVRGIHLTGKRAAQIAQRAGVQSLALTHVPPWNEPGTALREAQGYFSGPVCEVAPGQLFEI